MRVEIKMPDLSTTNATVRVVSWHVKIGQVVKRGQPLLEVETDKAVMDVEAFISGTLSEIVAPPDSEVEVGQLIGLIETGGG